MGFIVDLFKGSGGGDKPPKRDAQGYQDLQNATNSIAGQAQDNPYATTPSNSVASSGVASTGVGMSGLPRNLVNKGGFGGNGFRL